MKDTFALHLCNYPEDERLKGKVDHFFQKVSPFNQNQSRIQALILSLLSQIGMDEDSLSPLSVHTGHAHEVFDKKNVVILTPDSPNNLDNFRQDDVYVIGGIAGTGGPLSLVHAKTHGLRHARFPLR